MSSDLTSNVWKFIYNKHWISNKESEPNVFRLESEPSDWYARYENNGWRLVSDRVSLSCMKKFEGGGGDKMLFEFSPT